jgi:hypothetical protein
MLLQCLTPPKTQTGMIGYGKTCECTSSLFGCVTVVGLEGFCTETRRLLFRGKRLRIGGADSVRLPTNAELTPLTPRDRFILAAVRDFGRA